MSLFKVNEWWSNDKLRSGETSEGLQNTNCLKVDKFIAHADSDCLVFGEGMLLKIYKPSQDAQDIDATHILLEAQLTDMILQIETGKFIAGAEDRQILILHPQSYAIYQLNRKEGHTDAGDQNILKLITKHSFTRRAHSLTCGPFGNIKTRDFICIQALDGSLSFFDQETFLFMYISSDVIIPGPVAYIANNDSFVICKSTWVLEIYSYQQLREYGEPNTRQNKRHIPQWVYNAGEEISSVQVIQTSNNISSILALGERHLCCFQDNGLMKYMIKFDYVPICFHAYLIGWYYEPTARLLVMVSSENSKLNIYEGTKLLWSCDLLHTAISISRCFLKSLPGGIVTLSANGVVTVSYLGTDPDLNSNAGPMITATTELDLVQKELEEVEGSLKKMLDGEEDVDEYAKIDQIIKIKADVCKIVQNLHPQITRNRNEALHLLMCPVMILLTCENPKFVQSVQITFGCSLPFTCTDSTVCIENINGTEIIETQVFVSSEGDISDTSVKIMFTIIESTGKINVIDKKIMLPLSLYCMPTEVANENGLVLRLQTNHPCIDLFEVFTDFSKEHLMKHCSSEGIMSFIYRTNHKTVTIKTNDNEYSIQADEYSDISAILEYIVTKLSGYYERMNLKHLKMYVKVDEEFEKSITHTFMKSIETHSKERIKLKSLTDGLNVLQKQFTLIQKRLLVQYGSLPPGDCDPLEFLMRDTHQRIVKTVLDIIECKEIVCRAGENLSAIGRLLIFIFRQSTSDTFKAKLIEEMFTLGSLYEDYQEWEEAVTQALTYILNNVFQKSEKDKEKLAPLTEQGVLSHINLKRFLKQIIIILENMFSEIRDELIEKPKKVTRIEEFVEVI